MCLCTCRWSEWRREPSQGGTKRIHCVQEPSVLMERWISVYGGVHKQFSWNDKAIFLFQFRLRTVSSVHRHRNQGGSGGWCPPTDQIQFLPDDYIGPYSKDLPRQSLTSRLAKHLDGKKASWQCSILILPANLTLWLKYLTGHLNISFLRTSSMAQVEYHPRLLTCDLIIRAQWKIKLFTVTYTCLQLHWTGHCGIGCRLDDDSTSTFECHSSHNKKVRVPEP